MMKIGLEAGGINCIMGYINDEDGDFKRQLQVLRKACVNEKSWNNYVISVTNMINWLTININEA